jgi:hypothetical protein
MAATLIDRGAQIRTIRAAAGLGDPLETERFFSSDGLTSDAGPIASPFPDTVPSSAENDALAIVDNAFVTAVNNGRLAVAQLLLERGARVNEKPPGFHWHGTALHAAVWRGDRELVEWLLSVGADTTIRDGLGDSDAIGWARHHDHPELVGLLAR